MIALEQVGPRLRVFRQRAEMSQSDVEALSGIPKARISRYENGHVAPSIESLGKLCQALEIQPGEILDEGDS